MTNMKTKYSFYEFFAGGGMVRIGLGSEWSCVFANDNSSQKASAYKAYWGEEEFDKRGVDEISPDDLPPSVQLAWASFPCQDLSVAGAGRGVGSTHDRATRSSALWPFLDLMADLKLEERHPSVIVLENVTGLLTSSGGRDFGIICEALAGLGYDFGAVVVDAKHFVPQSRPRVFIVAARDDLKLPDGIARATPLLPWHSAGVVNAHNELSPQLVRRWRWWDLGPSPVLAENALAGAIDLGPRNDWHDPTETQRLLSMMPNTHRARLTEAKEARRPMIGSLYLRMRPGSDGNVQCAEIAFAPTLGCLRTPRGGGSRPRIIVVDGEDVRTRLLSPREAARLMGLPDDYPLPENYQHAFQIIGDGVVVPVVSFLDRTLLGALAAAERQDVEIAERPPAPQEHLA